MTVSVSEVIYADFFEKSFSFLYVLEINAFEKHGKLGTGECDTRFACRRQREMKGSFFETFIPNGKAVIVPVEDFDFVT